MRGIVVCLCALGCNSNPPDTDKLVQLDTLVDGGAGDAGAALRIVLQDEHHAPAAARVSVWMGTRDSTTLMPSPAMHARFQPGWSGSDWVKRIAWIYADGDVTLPVPPDAHVTIEVQRGLEYRPVSITRSVPMGYRRDVTVALERWIDQSALGWWSGDNHVHRRYGNDTQNPTISVDDAARMIRGEDLNVVSLVAGNRSTMTVYDQMQVPAPPQTLTPRNLYQFNAEFRPGPPLGHSLQLGLTAAPRAYFNAASVGTDQALLWPTNSDIADDTKGQGGTVEWAHPLYQPPIGPTQNDLGPLGTSLELPVAAANGLVDAVDILHPTTDENGSTLLYYKLLNTGIKLAASGATDTELDSDIGNADPMEQPPPGINRVYVKLPGALGHADWLAGLRARRTFCTNGPMLELSVEGHAIGESFDLPRGDGGPSVGVRVIARAKWRAPLNELQIVVNGTVVARQSGPGTELAFNQIIQLSESSWIAARINEQPSSNEVSDKQVFAHTSPVWVTLGGAVQRNATDAAYLLTQVNEFGRFMLNARYPTTAAQMTTSARITRAQQFFQNQM